VKGNVLRIFGLKTDEVSEEWRKLNEGKGKISHKNWE
jgi:hypothetical protein